MTQKLARLSRCSSLNLKLPRSKRLTAIQEYVEVLQGVDVAGLGAHEQVTGFQDVVRPDELH